MTKLNWKKIICDRPNFWTASGVGGGRYMIDGPVRDFTRGDPDGVVHYPVHHLSGHRSKPRMGRYLEPPAATLAKAKALTQADNIRLHRARKAKALAQAILSTTESAVDN
jgi:hypothetical protein